MDMTTSITVYEPDPSWPHQFESDRHVIHQAFSGQLVAYYHVGSTAIAHLAARPIIDVLVEVVNIDQLSALEPIWKNLRLESGSDMGAGINYRFLRRLPPHRSLHLHVFEHGDPQVRHWLALQEYLKSNPHVCHLYGRLKRKLMVDSKGELLAYERTKRRFIQQAMVKSATHVTTPSSPSRGYNHFMTMPQVSRRIWDNYCLYLNTLFRYCPHTDPVPYPNVAIWKHQNNELNPFFSSLFRCQIPNDEEALRFAKFLAKDMRLDPRPRSFWASHFDTPQELIDGLEDIGFVKARKRTFCILNVANFETYDDKKTFFNRIYHSRDLYAWVAQLRQYYNIENLHEFFTSIPSNIYNHGEPLEIYLVQYGEKVMGAIALHLYREGLGIVELVYENRDILRHILNFAVQRARSLHYPYVFTQSLESYAEDTLKLGMAALFPVQEWHFHV